MKKRDKRLQIQQERLKEFSHQIGDYYEEKQVGNQWFVKMWNGVTNRWQVAIFTSDSFKRYKMFQNNGD